MAPFLTDLVWIISIMEGAVICPHLKRQFSGYKTEFPDSNGSASTTTHGVTNASLIYGLHITLVLTMENISQQKKCSPGSIRV